RLRGGLGLAGIGLRLVRGVEVGVPAAALEHEAGPADQAGQGVLGAAARAVFRRRIAHLLESVRRLVALAAFVFVDGHGRSGEGRGVRLGKESKPLEGGGDGGGRDTEAAGEGGGDLVAVRAERIELAGEVAAEGVRELPLDAEVLEVLA